MSIDVDHAQPSDVSQDARPTTRKRCSSTGRVLRLRRPDEIVSRADEFDSWRIECRPQRRLGQHKVLYAGEVLGLDAVLAKLHARGADARYVISLRPDAQLLALQDIRRFAESLVLVQFFEGDVESHLMLDDDQMSALLGQGWTVPKDEHAVPPSLCGSWTFKDIALRAPGDCADDNDSGAGSIRDTIAGLPRYGAPSGGQGSAPADETDNQQPVTIRVAVARPTRGSGSGHPGIEVTEEQAAQIADKPKDGDWVCLRRDLGSASGPKTLLVPATVRIMRSTSIDTQSKPREKKPDSRPVEGVGIDQVLRLALGIGTWEDFEILPFKKREKARAMRTSRLRPGREKPVRFRKPNSLPARLLQRWSPTVHVVARAQPSELTLTEQRACLLSELALDSLGLASGDEVVIHAARDGGTKGGGLVHSKIRLKAYKATKDVVDRRQQIHGGGRGALLPSEESAFGMSQALSWIWLDDAVRTRLGLPASLGAVVVAPSRRFAVVNQFRELAVVLGLALFSASFRLEEPYNGLALGASFFVPGGMILWRIASRLK